MGSRTTFLGRTLELYCLEEDCLPLSGGKTNIKTTPPVGRVSAVEAWLQPLNCCLYSICMQICPLNLGSRDEGFGGWKWWT